MRYLLDRLSERSTWIGITATITGAGVGMSPELATSIIGTGSTIAGLISMMTKDQ